MKQLGGGEGSQGGLPFHDARPLGIFVEELPQSGKTSHLIVLDGYYGLTREDQEARKDYRTEQNFCREWQRYDQQLEIEDANPSDGDPYELWRAREEIGKRREAFLAELGNDSDPALAYARMECFARAPEPEVRAIGSFLAGQYARKQVLPVAVAARALHRLARDPIPEVRQSANHRLQTMWSLLGPDREDELLNQCFVLADGNDLNESALVTPPFNPAEILAGLLRPQLKLIQGGRTE